MKSPVMSVQLSCTLTHLASIAGHCDVHLSALASKAGSVIKSRLRSEQVEETLGKMLPKTQLSTQEADITQLCLITTFSRTCAQEITGRAKQTCNRI